MTHIEYFKLQAKNLFRDYKTQTSYIDEVDGYSYYTYTPKYFDIDSIFLEYNLDEEDEENLTLMKAQHLFSLMLGFEKWADILKASEARLELARLLWDKIWFIPDGGFKKRCQAECFGLLSIWHR
jgi:hypothetical protein